MISSEDIKNIDIVELSSNADFLSNLKKVADKRIGNYSKGDIVESKELLEPIWSNYGPLEQRELGKCFRVLVESGFYPKLKYMGKKSNRHAKYKVLV
jgi:hypothetical protein